MGGKSSKKWEHGSLHIHLVDDVKQFTAGEEIKGEVWMSTTMHLNLYSIVVRLEGKDASKHVETTTSTDGNGNTTTSE